MSMINQIKKILNIKDIQLSGLVRNSIFNLILKIAGMAIGYLTMIFITKYYGAATFGIYTLSITIMSVFALIPRFGMGIAMVRIVGELYTHSKYYDILKIYRKVVIFSGGMALLFSLLLYSSAPELSSYFLYKPFMSSYLQIIAFAIFPTVLIIIISATLQGMKFTTEYMFIQTILQQFIFLILLIVNESFSLSYNIVCIYTISVVLSLLIGSNMLRNKMKYILAKPTVGSSKYDLKKILTIAYPMLLSSSIMMVINWTDILMIGAFLKEEDVGIYNVAYRIAGLVNISLIAINSVVTPQFISHYTKEDYQGLSNTTKNASKMSFLLSSPIIIIFLIFPNYILHFFGDEFTVGSTAFIIVAIGQFANAITGAVASLLMMTDNQKIFQNVMLGVAFMNIVLNYILIPIYGINGAAMATASSMIISNFILMYIVFKKFGFLSIYIPRFKKEIN